MAEEEAKGPEALPAEGDELEAGYQAAEDDVSKADEPLTPTVDETVEEDADTVEPDEEGIDVVDAPSGAELGEGDLPEPEAFEVDDEEAEELEDEQDDLDDIDEAQLEEAEEDAAQAKSPAPVATKSAKDRPTRKPAATPSFQATAKVPEKKNRPTRTRAEATALDAPKKTTLGTFISQVVQELKKVVWPSSAQLWQYFVVVLIFVLVIIAFIGVLDYAFGLLVMWLFK